MYVCMHYVFTFGLQFLYLFPFLLCSPTVCSQFQERLNIKVKSFYFCSLFCIKFFFFLKKNLDGYYLEMIT